MCLLLGKGFLILANLNHGPQAKEERHFFVQCSASQRSGLSLRYLVVLFRMAKNVLDKSSLGEGFVCWINSGHSSGSLQLWAVQQNSKQHKNNVPHQNVMRVTNSSTLQAAWQSSHQTAMCSAICSEKWNQHNLFRSSICQPYVYDLSQWSLNESVPTTEMLHLHSF